MIIRTDASVVMGTGHVMRCLTLADELRHQGHTVTFICRELEGNLCDLVSHQGYEVLRLPYTNSASDGIGEGLYEKWLAVRMNLEMQQVEKILSAHDGMVDWLVVDHYALDRRWHQQMRPFVGGIMVLDAISIVMSCLIKTCTLILSHDTGDWCRLAVEYFRDLSMLCCVRNLLKRGGR